MHRETCNVRRLRPPSQLPVQLEQLPYQVNKQKMNQTPDQLHADLMKDTVAFPVLSAAELQECAEFGTRCSFAAGEDLFRAGAQPLDCYVILSGEACIIDVSTDEPTYLTRHRGGQFTGDIDLFTGRRAANVGWRTNISRTLSGRMRIASTWVIAWQEAAARRPVNKSMSPVNCPPRWRVR